MAVSAASAFQPLAVDGPRRGLAPRSPRPIRAVLHRRPQTAWRARPRACSARIARPVGVSWPRARRQVGNRDTRSCSATDDADTSWERFATQAMQSLLLGISGPWESTSIEGDVVIALTTDPSRTAVLGTLLDNATNGITAPPGGASDPSTAAARPSRVFPFPPEL
jgi:hypothetical protein